MQCQQCGWELALIENERVLVCVERNALRDSKGLSYGTSNVLFRILSNENFNRLAMMKYSLLKVYYCPMERKGQLMANAFK